MATESIQPRVLRIKDAPAYLGMNKNKFNKDVRPHIQEIQLGKRAIGFDRKDLDKWLSDFKNGKETWPKGSHQASSGEEKPCTWKKDSVGSEFEAVATQLMSQKPRRSLPRK